MVPASAQNQQDGCCSLSSPSLCSELGKRNEEVGQQQEESPPGNRGKSGLHNDRSGCIMIGNVCVSR